MTASTATRLCRCTRLVLTILFVVVGLWLATSASVRLYGPDLVSPRAYAPIVLFPAGLLMLMSGLFLAVGRCARLISAYGATLLTALCVLQPAPRLGLVVLTLAVLGLGALVHVFDVLSRAEPVHRS